MLALIQILSLDVDLDGKKETIYMQLHPVPVVDIAALGLPPAHVVEIYVKRLGKLELAGRFEAVTMKTYTWHFGERKKPHRVLVIFEAVVDSRTSYWGMGSTGRLIPVPPEMMK